MSRLVAAAFIVVVGVPNIAQATNTLDDVYRFLKGNLEGRTLVATRRSVGADGERIQTKTTFIASNVSRSDRALEYRFQVRQQTRRRLGETSVTLSAFFCRLGFRASTGSTRGFCIPTASSGRPLVGSSLAVTAELLAPDTLRITEDPVGYVDVPAPNGALVPGGVVFIAMVQSTADGRVSVRETVQPVAVDPDTLERTAVGAPILNIYRDRTPTP